METIEAREFINMAKNSDDSETKARGRNVEIGISGISSQVMIVMEGSLKGAMAFVEANNDNVAYLDWDTTLGAKSTKHALVHEDFHNRVRFWGLPLEENFMTDHAHALSALVGLSLESDNESLMEGFHEMVIIEREGVDPKVAYNYREVPAAQKLENLGKKLLGISLLEVYKSGNHEKMSKTLKELADRCLLLKASSKIETIERIEIDKMIYQKNIEVTNTQNAEEILIKWQLRLWRQKIQGQDANDNSIEKLRQAG